MLNLTINWQQKEVCFSTNDITFTNFLQEKFPLEKNVLFSAKFESPLVSDKDSVVVDEILFNDFTIVKDILIFFTPIAVSFSDVKNVTINISDPLPKQLPEIFNAIPRSSNQELFYAMFFKDPNSDYQLKYLASVQCQWSQLYEQIKIILAENGYGPFGVSIGFGDEGNATQHVPASTFFSKRTKMSSRRMSMVITLQSTKKLTFFLGSKSISIDSAPTYLRNLVSKTAHILNSNVSSEINTICRRIILACLNGGVTLDLLRLLKSKTDAENDQLFSNYDSDSDDDLVFDLSPDQEELNSVSDNLKVNIHNFKNHLMKNSSESQFRSVFWDPIFSELVYSRINSSIITSPELNYHLLSEWETRSLFPELEDRLVDYSIILKGTDFNIPIMLVEMGKEAFGNDLESHKDFSKLVGIMSKCCIKMAHLFETKNGKRAELARVYGAWIGGSQIQFVVAKPIVKAIGDHFEIHCVIRSPSSWKFDLLNDEKAPTESSSDEEGILKMAQDSTDEETIQRLEKIKNEVLPKDEGEKDILADINEFYNLAETSDEEDGRLSIISANLNNIKEAKLYSGHFDISVLYHLKTFVYRVIDMIELFSANSDLETAATLPRRFQDPTKNGAFPASRDSSTKNTPKSTRVQEGWFTRSESGSFTSPSKRNKSHDDVDVLEVSKYNGQHELRIYMNFLTQIPGTFPKLMEYKVDPEEPSLIHFLFENMIPFLSYHDGTVSYLLSFQDLEEGLVKGLRFSIELFYCLYLLHKTFRLVHGNIRPENIACSPEFEVWKLIDFKNSMDITASASTPRKTLGKEIGGFTAPETILTGFHPEASDIFSLGQDEEIDPKLNQSFSRFENVIMRMCRSDPEERCSVDEALFELFDILTTTSFRRTELELYPKKHPTYQRIQFLSDEALKKSFLNIENGMLIGISKIQPTYQEKQKRHQQFDENYDLNNEIK